MTIASVGSEPAPHIYRRARPGYLRDGGRNSSNMQGWDIGTLTMMLCGCIKIMRRRNLVTGDCTIVSLGRTIDNVPSMPYRYTLPLRLPDSTCENKAFHGHWLRARRQQCTAMLIHVIVVRI